ncbi:gliding motility-associated C-terminal domain-containing protein [Solirubrum puertoriconensis]|uniref:PKD domain-containing protein n=1 Tax=Solirubrum puertoriconensis TaxID=1751427 RepID=A0A9X0HLW6_SOLP1|nr:gliding motility-associated C-terminal domain-containing protein [Solirubrum puertoriconensis]KUG08234.1 hypothetical protein ASU33_08605 [Solirubrum puertoriconensis]
MLLPLTMLASAPPERSLEFIENKGQWDARARYAAPLPAGGRMFVEPGGLTYSLFDPTAFQHGHSPEAGKSAALPPQQDAKIKAHAYRMRFVDARKNTKLEPIEATKEVRNYLLGADAKKWASNVGSYRELRYRGLWNGIDAHLYENKQSLFEYDFELQPKADPNVIKLRYEGADAIRLRADGALEIKTSVGTVTELVPRAWQLGAGGERQPVSCRYVLRGQEVSFALGRYDRARPLLIDPTVVFSTFTGASADNWGFTATYDQQGNMYSGGIADGSGYPVSTGAYDTSFGGVWDIAIIKYNTATTGAASRVWATYLGGSAMEAPHSMVVNSRGELIVLGSTSSSNYPTTSSAYDRSFAGGRNFSANGLPYANGVDIVVTRLNAAGSGLLGSTYVGGSSNDGVLESITLANNYGDQFRGDVIVDANDNVYFASSTSSASNSAGSNNFPVVRGFRNSYQGGSSDAVVCKLTPDLSDLVWSTFLGGANSDAAYSIQLNAAGEVYVSGGTNSDNIGNANGAYFPTRRGDIDGFIARISTTGNQPTLERLTYLGTTAYDQAYFIQLDDQGGVYALGQTRGSVPVTTGVYSIANGKQFIQKLSADLSTLLISTTFGSGRSAPDLSPTAFLVDQCERIYVCGWGGTNNVGNGNVAGLITTANAMQRTSDGNDFYLIQFAPYATAVEYATYFGGTEGRGEHVDGGTSRFDRRGFVYQAVCGGCGGSSSFPVPPGAGTYSNRNNSGNCNNAAFKIDFGINAAVAGPNQNICIDAAPLRLGGQPSGGTWSGTGVSGSVAAGYTFTPSVAQAGTHKLTYSVASTGTCVTTSTLDMTVVPISTINFSPLAPACVNGNTVQLTATPAGGTFSGPGVAGTTFSPAVAGTGTHTITYTLPSPMCGSTTQRVVVSPNPQVVAGTDTALCSFQRTPYMLKGASPAGGTWSGPGCTPQGLFTPPAGVYGPIMLTYSYTNSEGCTQTAQRRVMLVPENRSNLPLQLPECPLTPRQSEGMPAYTWLAPFTHVFNHDMLFASSYSWDFGDGTTSKDQFPTHTYEKPGTYQVSFTAYYNGSCEAKTVFAPVYVGTPFIPNIITPNADGQNDVFEQRLSCLPVTLKVFSRWGKEVYTTTNYQNNWNGGTLPDGVYYYQLVDTDGRKAKGWLEIRR